MFLNDFKVPSHQLKIHISMEVKTEDLSGETSSTSTTNKGIKPKTINASFVVPFQEAEKVREFYQLAQETNSNGELLVYTITDKTANSANIMQVMFTGRIEQRELNDLQGWRISFTLREFGSNAEKAEHQQRSNGETATNNFSGAEEQKNQEGIIGFETVLRKANSKLAYN